MSALLCNSGNPVVSGPQGERLDAALAQLDLLVGVDLVQRASHRHAHWLLPAAHWLERDDLITIYAHFEDQPFAQLGRAAVTPPPGVQEEWQTWVALADAMGLELFGGPASAAPTPRELQRTMVDNGGRITWEQLEVSPSRLSAMLKARACSAVRCSSRITGTLRQPSRRAACTRPWPARRRPWRSAKTGTLKPNSSMLRAISLICRSLWSLGLRGSGLSCSTGTCSIRSAVIPWHPR